MSIQTSIETSLETLAACLTLGVQEDGSDVCYSGVIAGVGVPELLSQCTDRDKCGLAYVRLITTYPSQTVGVQDQTVNNCAAGIGFDTEVGIYRCYPLRADGKALDADTQLRVARRQQDDIEIMRNAIACCDWLPAEGDLIMGGWTPAGPQGAWIGGVFIVYGWLGHQFPSP